MRLVLVILVAMTLTQCFSGTHLGKVDSESDVDSGTGTETDTGEESFPTESDESPGVALNPNHFPTAAVNSDSERYHAITIFSSASWQGKSRSSFYEVVHPLLDLKIITAENLLNEGNL